MLKNDLNEVQHSLPLKYATKCAQDRSFNITEDSIFPVGVIFVDIRIFGSRLKAFDMGRRMVCFISRIRSLDVLGASSAPCKLTIFVRQI